MNQELELQLSSHPPRSSYVDPGNDTCNSPSTDTNEQSNDETTGDTHHLDRIELAMKFREEYALVTSFSNDSLKQRDLIAEVVLLTQQSSHAAVLAVNRTYRGAFCFQGMHIEASLLENSLQAFGFVFRCRHLLRQTSELGIWVCIGYDSIVLDPLLATVRLIHAERVKCVWRK